MNNLNLGRKCYQVMLLGIHAVRVIFADGVLCAICGALYGIVFGGFGAQARNELTVSGVMAIGGLCAMVGFVIGAVVGILGEVSRVRNLRRQLSEATTRTVSTFRESQQFHRPESLTGVTRNQLIVVTHHSRPKVTLIGQ